MTKKDFFLHLESDRSMFLATSLIELFIDYNVIYIYIKKKKKKATQRRTKNLQGKYFHFEN